MKPLWYYRDSLTGKREFNIMMDILETYGKYRYDGKVVLDIGADFGLSPAFFLHKGASKVIAYSPERQKNWLRDSRIEWHREYWKGQFQEADILKIDCEGCEYSRPLDWYAKHFHSSLFAIHDFPQYHSLFEEYREGLLNLSAYQIFSAGKEIMFVWGF
jgi:hypothetical protein